MKLSTRVRYGCRAMVELAARGHDGPVALETMAAAQHISERYLAKIIQDLRRSGLIRSVRGPHGGYALNREPAEITMLDIWEALEGSLAPVGCLDDPAECGMVDNCVMRGVWAAFRKAAEGVLGGADLAALARRHKRRMRSTKSSK